ncbi:hypothetical protein [Methylobacterium planeticum]|uniref:Uncharacterized protein n=1 Tax=Methylobacterium planeticum TaxID=2615211 RepID=A0A6N6MEC3_9HYPH|nr:hypothetical protein [Methylobacterium planeticum]KAB1068579.1 hypothetical protein F6X51_26640 [Methylobacterium planeticum]
MRQYRSPALRAAAAGVAQDILDANAGLWGTHEGLPDGAGNVARAGLRLARRVKDLSDGALRIDLLMDRFGPAEDLRGAPREVRALVHRAWQALSEASLIMANLYHDEETELWLALPLAERVERFRRLGRELLRAEWLGLADEMQEERQRFRDKLLIDAEAAEAMGLKRLAADPLYDFARAIGYAMPAVRAT